MSARRGLAAASAALAFFVAVSFATAESLHTAAARTPITINATSIAFFDMRDPERTRFGALAFRGGLVLTANHQAFGGISALHMQPDGEHFLAVTDNGSWLRARIVYKDGRPAAVADAEMAPVLVPHGAALAKRGWFDMESLAERDGVFYVGIECVEKERQIRHAQGRACRAWTADRGATRFQDVHIQQEPRVPRRAAEGCAACRQADRRHRAQPRYGGQSSRLPARRRQGRAFFSESSGGFDVSDCAIVPPRDLLLLERSFSLLAGIAMRIRRIPLVDLKEGAVVDGPVLITADMAFQIDNMEGLGVHRTPEGETVLTLVSDDNFSMLQRTLLLQFTVEGSSGA